MTRKSQIRCHAIRAFISSLDASLTRTTLATFLLGTVISLVAPLSIAAKPKHFYTNWKWWVGETVILGAIAADAHSTCVGVNHGFVETNPIAPHTGGCNAKFALWMASGAAFETSVHVLSYQLFKDDPSKGWRTTSLLIMPVTAAIGHGTAAIHNYRLEDGK